ncbi:transmembrane protein, putative (macronuclear) [Tetrahymena thermophila SB210]|uniref:Transmembrane protein, putative n=1 Tax=Tetrahymena thermophila (strain SB210) TaxID=312017 RepID=Q24FP7_TETTS|nr:transmembrane protein, putative [Tetrahymena thermophila SB210]EAS06597.3 transmembrane protein, putative [Tetrahymena thermophila SB210]|eukprot:XP_001026842.3 transmembrane protein, putative [Tetrahymena thermophila SB210]
MKTLIVLSIALICIQAQAFQVDNEDLKQLYNFTHGATTYNQTEQYLNNSAWTQKQLPPVPQQYPHEIDEQNSTDVSSFNKTKKHGERDHKNHEKQREEHKWEKKHHEGKKHEREEDEKRHQNHKREKHHREEESDHENRRGGDMRKKQGKHEEKNDQGHLRSSSNLVESKGSGYHSQFKKQGSKLKMAYKRLPKPARIAINIASILLVIAVLVKLVKCCKRKRQQRRERQRTMREQYVQQQTVQQQLNSSNNPHELFLQQNSQPSIPVGQPVQMNYQYPQLTNTLISQQQLQPQQPRVAIPVVHAQPYYAVPSNEHASVPQRPVAIPSNQNFMTVELPQLSINNDQSSRQSVEVVDAQNVRRYPVLQQQNPYSYQQF